MHRFLFKQGECAQLQPFSHISEFGCKKIHNVQLHSLDVTSSDQLLIYFILEGKHEWLIGDQNYILYPGDLALILPGKLFGNPKGFLDLGAIMWLSLIPGRPCTHVAFDNWSSLHKPENRVIQNLLTVNAKPVINNFSLAGEIFHHMFTELTLAEIGYRSRVNQLIDELLISLARQISRQENKRRDFPQIFLKLEETLRQNLSHQWSVEEMAALVGLGTTSFTEKVKSFTGFSPLNYLINIRISESIKLLKRTEFSVTQIALETGFYSSQHFATTFKKITGYTPMHFKKNNT